MARPILSPIVTAALLLSAAARLAADWPHWRGPSFDGVSKETGLPAVWSQTQNITWKLTLPAWSGATPIIWGEHIFLNVAETADALALWAVDRANGQVRWKAPLGGGNVKLRKQNMSSPSPVTDGRRVWVMTGTGILKSFDFTGKELWARNIQKDYGRFGLNWGYASSPLLHDGSLFVQVLHGMKTDDPSYVLRIDATTGKTIWRIERPTKAIRESPDSYTTPALVRIDGRVEIVVSGGDCVTGHDPATGQELWRANGLNPRNDPNYRIVASPVVGTAGFVYVPSRERPLLAVRSGGRGDVTATHVAWKFDSGPDVPTPVSDGRYLYVVNDRGIMFCLDAKTGVTIWGPERIAPGTYSASPVLADGKLYMINEDGLTTVVKARPTFEKIAANPLDDYTLSSPAISQGQIFIRTASALWAIGSRRR
ncbi:MAG: PQQ-binding-like beta-propeller repeat protein [Acidobacteria bacterium]|nr:PQQ-binding-like beta-propeller repeat protein [Acidobacteriota bacterium]